MISMALERTCLGPADPAQRRADSRPSSAALPALVSLLVRFSTAAATGGFSAGFSRVAGSCFVSRGNRIDFSWILGISGVPVFRDVRFRRRIGRMGEALADAEAEAALARFEAAAAELNAVALTRCRDEDVVTVLARVETVRRKSAVLDQRLIVEVQSRGLPHEYGAGNAATFLRELLRIGIGEARSRVANAEAAGSRVQHDGEVLEPVFTTVAAAQAGGEISRAHAQVVVSTIEKLPDHLAAEIGETVEAILVEQARVLDPDTLARFATHLRTVLDQDGTLDDDAYNQRRRAFTLRRHADGSSTPTGQLTAEATEYLATALDSLNAPAGGEEPDRRTHLQRNHDALLELARLTMRAQLLPDAGGVSTTVILTMTREAFATGVGTATTGHGVVLAADTAKAWADGENRVIGAIFNHTYGVEELTTTARFFTTKQRYALIARDHGCAFPGCDTPPQRCEAHHITEREHSGPTSIDNGVLLCRFHHHQIIHNTDWQIVMINQVPHFIPPKLLDPERKPRRNHMHHPQHILQPV
jgi:hypothetical protein